jgi:hypothetical protein
MRRGFCIYRRNCKDVVEVSTSLKSDKRRLQSGSYPIINESRFQGPRS